jgi:DNA/RNA endonuclease YhcR with UshA esterase domain
MCLDMGHAYPGEDFAVVIWGEDRSKFGTPESLAGQRVCVTGPIRQYRGRPEVVLRDPSQLGK